MSDTGQNRFEIDLDEIERQLRRSAELGPTASPPQDPLAELARIVGQDDPFLNILGDGRKADAGRGRQEPVFDKAPHETAASAAQPGPREQADAVLTNEDRDVLGSAAPQSRDDDVSASGERFDPVAHTYGDAGPIDTDDFMPMPPPRARRRIGTVMALVALTAVGAAGAFTWRKMGGNFTPSGPPPLITADKAPLKVAPENPGGIDIPNQNKQIYEGKVDTGRSRVLDRQEQPIDVKEAARQMTPAEPPPPAPALPTPAAQPQVNGQLATASPVVAAPVPAVAPTERPAQTGAGSVAPAPIPAQPRSAVVSALGEPRRVRTVAVRPDGSAIGAAGGMMIGDPNTQIFPSGDLPAPIHVPTVSIPANGTAAPTRQAPAAPAVAAVPAQPLPSATPPTDATATPSSTATPIRVLPPHRPRGLSANTSTADPTPEPVSTAAAAPAAPAQGSSFPFNFGRNDAARPATPEPASGARTYAVQLAVRPSESAARTAYDQLADKFATDLGGKPATVTEAKVNGRAVYRIRVTPLSREDANDLCTRLKGSGGQCFVVAN